MKTHLLIALLVVFGVNGWSVAAAEGDDSRRQAVNKLFELTGIPQKIEESVDTVLAIQLGQNPGLREHEDLVRAFLEKQIGWDGLRDDIMDMYLNAFTEQEVNEMNAFYASPTGRKVIKLLPELVQQRNRIAMQRMQDNIGELNQMIENKGRQQPR